MIEARSKVYFLSDFHLGAPDPESSRKRELKIIRWLDQVSSDAREIYILGDVFDFWFEYNTAVPKGYVRLLGKLAMLSDMGIKIHYFTGNHDMWVFDYLPTEIGAIIYREPISVVIGDKKFHIGHGDGLGPGDHGYKFIKKIFANRVCQWLFRLLHPDLGIPLAMYFSRKSRIATGNTDEVYLGDENEWLVQYCKDKLRSESFDFMVFGHRHLPIDMRVSTDCRYINLGEWINHFTYAEFDGHDLVMKKFEEGNQDNP